MDKEYGFGVRVTMEVEGRPYYSRDEFWTHRWRVELWLFRRLFWYEWFRRQYWLEGQERPW